MTDPFWRGALRGWVLAHIVVGVIVVAMLLPAPADAHHARGYTPDVVEVRQWLRKPAQNTPRQWRCLNRLWLAESHWRVDAVNPTSGAWGIPQALPGRKMRSAGRDWRTSAWTQVKWGRRYIRARYSTPCWARLHQIRKGWY